MKLIMENWRKFISEQEGGDQRFHIVKKGDTLFKISKKYNIPLDNLLKLNPKFDELPRNRDKIYPGEKVLLSKAKEDDDYEDEDEDAVLQDLWITISEYVDELISTRKELIKQYLYQMLIYNIIMNLYSKNPNASEDMKNNTRDSFIEEYYNLLGKFGPGPPESILNKRDKLNVLDPLGSQTYRDSLISVDIDTKDIFDDVLLYYFIAKVGSIINFKINDKQINKLMSNDGGLKKIYTIMRDHSGPIDEEGNSLYAEISDISLGSAADIKQEVYQRVESYFTDEKISFFMSTFPDGKLASPPTNPRMTPQ